MITFVNKKAYLKGEPELLLTEYTAITKKMFEMLITDLDSKEKAERCLEIAYKLGTGDKLVDKLINFFGL